LQEKGVMTELMEVCVVLMEFFAFVLAATACACIFFVLFFWSEELIRSAGRKARFERRQKHSPMTLTKTA
jgi:hypothetical protein